MVEEFTLFVQSNIAYAPWAIFGLLLLAGLNIPVSEDVMLFLSAVLAQQHPEYFWSLFFAVYVGAYLSDVICYSLGRLLGPRLLAIRWFRSMVSESRVARISGFYARFGIATLVVGRFIPFGVRNALFLTAGFGRMSAVRFCLADFVACTISCTFFFALYYTFGVAVVDAVKQANIAIFAMFVVGLVGFAAISWWRRRRQLASPAVAGSPPQSTP